MRPVERINRLGGGLQQHLAALLREISLGFRRQMHIAHLARAENELLASPDTELALSRAQRTKPCLLRSQHSYVVSVEPRTRLLGHTDP